MAGLTYRQKSKLKTALRIVLLVLAAIVLLAVLRFVYLGRFLVYDADGAHFDRSGASLSLTQEEAAAPAGDFKLISVAPTEKIADAEASDRISGIYLTVPQLTDEAVRTACASLPEGCNTVLLDVRTATGRALYPTALGETANADVDEIAQWIESLSRKGHITLAARIPAFRDSAFSLQDFSNALPIAGGALWMDANGSYCLDPASDEVRQYLIAEAEELASLGFREIVFDHFDFTDSRNIVYHSDGQQAAVEAAQVIADALAARNIAVSFGSDDPELLKLSAHAWIETDGGELVSALVREYSALLPDGENALVFLTASKDTRFRNYGVLTPPQ